MKSFPALAVSQALSLVGSRMTGVAIGFGVYATTGKVAPLLLFSFFAELPATLLGSLAGALADRHDARRMAVFADALQAAGSAFLAASFLGGFFSPAVLYATGLLQGVGAALQEPAGQLLLARLVPDEGRDRANAILGAAHPAAGLLAPALAGLLYPVIGVAGIVAIDLSTFLVSAATLPGLRLPPALGGAPAAASPGPREGLRDSLLAGFRFLSRGGKRLAALILLAGLANFLLNGPLGLAVPYALARTGSEGASGFVLSLEGAGGIIGSLLLAWRGRSRGRAGSFLAGLAAAGLGMVGLGLSRQPLLLGLSLFLIIASLQTWSRLASIIMAEAPRGMEGRILALSSQLGYLGATASFFLVGPLADGLAEPAARAGTLPTPFLGPGGGMGLVILAAGAMLFLLALAGIANPGLRRLGKASAQGPSEGDESA